VEDTTMYRYIVGSLIYMTIIVATPLWGKCEDETHTPKSGNLGVL
jgi:hypothetical protein